jgi:hypothetical protein
VNTCTIFQRVFVAVSSLALWVVCVFVLTARYRDRVLLSSDSDDEAQLAEPSAAWQAWVSVVLPSAPSHSARARRN